MTAMMLWVLLAGPCEIAAPIDAGEVAPCAGVLVTADQARQAIKDRRELKVRQVFSCPECPKCPACPPPPPRPSVVSWALGGIVAGALVSAALGLVLAGAI